MRRHHTVSLILHTKGIGTPTCLVCRDPDLPGGKMASCIHHPIAAPNAPPFQPAYNEADFDETAIGDDIQVLTGSAVPSSGGRKKEGTRTKLSNFAPEENVNIVKSWLEISCDPIINTGQKKENFWQRVMNQYNARRDSYPERSLRSVQTRWDRIKQEASKFAGYLAEVHRDNASGTSDADKTTLAAALFANVEGHNFPFMHCWELLKDEPKWQEPKQKEKQPNDSAHHIPHDSTTIDLEDDDAAGGSYAKKPIGRDAAKGARKKKCSSGSTSSLEYASKLQDLSLQKMMLWQEENSKKVNRFELLASIEEKCFDEMREHNKCMLQLEQEKLKIMRDKLDMQMLEKEKEREEREKQEEERILKIDLDSCTPDLQMYYRTRRDAILEKIAARRPRNRQG